VLKERELSLADNEVLVETHLMGICGSDKSFFQGDLPDGVALPFDLGHEAGGVVVEVGAKVRELTPGDRVICFGWHNTFADYFKAPMEALQPALPNLNMDLASLGEPIACAMYSGMNCGVQLGDTAVVYGAGFAGQIIAQVLKQKGAHRVVVVDIVDTKLELACRLGADTGINAAHEDPVEKVKELTAGVGADLVVEAAGTEEAMNQATALLRPNGTFAFYSWITQPVTLNIGRWHDDGFNFVNTCLVHHTTQERQVWTPQVLRPVALDMIKTEPLLTDEYRLGDIQEAFERAQADATAVKIILRP
jgi:L-iditol 2-dehydrogenase